MHICKRYVCTGWQRLIGCLKVAGHFHKRATNYRALLRKMILKDKASHGSSPPCNDKDRKHRYGLCEASKEKTREFQRQLLHYFSKSNNESNHYHMCTCVNRNNISMLTVQPWCTFCQPVSYTHMYTNMLSQRCVIRNAWQADHRYQ